MKGYIARKIGIGFLQIFVVSIAIFCVLHVLPGDPVDALVSEKVPQERREELREEWGFNKPLPEQYLDWAKGVVSGDLGKSLKTGLKISDSMAMRVAYSLRLCGIALILQVLISIPLGSLAAWKRDSIRQDSDAVFADYFCDTDLLDWNASDPAVWRKAEFAASIRLYFVEALYYANYGYCVRRFINEHKIDPK